MYYTPHNQKTVTLNLKRIDLCDLLLACTLISAQSNAQKWDKLHDKLEQIIIDFDENNPADLPDFNSPEAFFCEPD